MDVVGIEAASGHEVEQQLTYIQETTRCFMNTELIAKLISFARFLLNIHKLIGLMNKSNDNIEQSNSVKAKMLETSLFCSLYVSRKHNFVYVINSITYYKSLSYTWYFLNWK